MTPSNGRTVIEDNALYARLWRLARPYLNTRQNEVHTLISVGLAVRLLDHEEGDAAVVVPAVILHDVGWKRIPEKLQLQAFGPHATAPGLNRRHETEGVEIARGLLAQVPLDPKRVTEILAIIDGHDSRSEAISPNDSLVKDADRLWRYTQEGFAIDVERFGETNAAGLDRLRANLPLWFLTATGRRLACELLRQREEGGPP